MGPKKYQIPRRYRESNAPACGLRGAPSCALQRNGLESFSTRTTSAEACIQRMPVGQLIAVAATYNFMRLPACGAMIAV